MVVTPVEPPSDLQQRIIERMREEAHYLRIRRRFAVLALMFFTSLAALPFAIFAVVEAARLSGFWAFTSLVFSDSAVVLSHWQDVGYSLLESFPVSEVALAGVLALVAASSVSFVVRESRNVWKHLPLLRVSR